jgi:hypothetical protein
MHTSRARRRASLAAVAIAALLGLGACSSSHSSDAGAAASSAKAAGQSALANPTYSADIAQLESELLTAYQQHFSPLHPFKSMMVAIHQVFPSGDASAIATYAVHQLTPAMAHKTAAGKAARNEWAQKVVKDALGSNPNATASPGSAVIPGTTPQATPKATGSTP